MTDAEVVAAIAPEWVGNARLDTMITLAATRMGSATRLGAVYQMAVIYLACHMLTVSAGSDGSGTGAGTGAAGTVTSRSAGGTSESYGSMVGSSSGSFSDASLATTTYGREYIALRNSRAARAPGVADNGV